MENELFLLGFQIAFQHIGASAFPCGREILSWKLAIIRAWKLVTCISFRIRYRLRNNNKTTPCSSFNRNISPFRSTLECTISPSLVASEITVDRLAMIDTVSFYSASLETPFSKNLNLQHIRGNIVFGNGSWLDKVDAIEIVTETWRRCWIEMCWRLCMQSQLGSSGKGNLMKYLIQEMWIQLLLYLWKVLEHLMLLYTYVHRHYMLSIYYYLVLHLFLLI